jgi:hypothetical protein
MPGHTALRASTAIILNMDELVFEIVQESDGGELGFVEAFRTPESGQPVHIELTLDGFTLRPTTLMPH